jgi:PAS domain S-box-containing protein
VLTIADTGIGIPESDLPHVFERFHRVEGARGRTYEGTGIGLALVQELAKLQGGVVSAASRVGQGSTFTVVVPFGSAHLPQERIESAPVQRASTVRVEAFTGEALSWVTRAESGTGASVAAAGVQPGNARPRVLLVDDNADMREHVSRILGQEYDLVTAADGQHAWELIRQDPPDVLLTDVMMPGIDGLELLRVIRSTPGTQTIPVILVSARAGAEMRVEGLEAGADDYLVKPFTAAELRARVSTHTKMAVARRKAMEREAALRAEAEAARDQAVQVLESITDGFLALDSAWRITYANAEAERLNGMKREEMLGRDHWELFPQAVGTTVHRELSRAAKERVPVEFENYYEPLNRWWVRLFWICLILWK